MRKKQKKRYDSAKRKSVNRKHKDRLFRFVFQEKEDLLELYNAINRTNYQNPDELEVTTLEDAIFLGMKNDLSFIIGATMNLYEHQSTWNANMPLRGLLYFSSLYQIYVEQQGYNLYGSVQIPLPAPNYVVFYNGDKEEPDEQELSLSDAFLKPENEQAPSLECRVKVLNINRDHNRELMERCQKLREYSEFIGCVKANLQNGMDISNATHKAMEDCIERGILAGILNRCRTEVMQMILTEYDEKKTRDYLRREAEQIGEQRGREIGREEGERRGREIGREIGREVERTQLIRNMLRKGRSEQEISDLTGYSMVIINEVKSQE
jgi:hypothetical protein